MKDTLTVLFSTVIGYIMGFAMNRMICDSIHNIPMEALGIERFQKCEINTTNCHSNWYEIIWKEKTK